MTSGDNFPKVLSNSSLTYDEAKLFQTNAFTEMVASVAEHYQMPLGCLAVQSPPGMYLKARIGALPSVLPHLASGKDFMCRHCVDRDMPIIIEDTALCPRVKDDPLVTGSPHVRFYVGTPIKRVDKDNVIVGTLCLFDTKPRILHVSDTAFLVRTAAKVASLFAENSNGRPLWDVCKSSPELEELEDQKMTPSQQTLGSELSETESEDEDVEEVPCAAPYVSGESATWRLMQVDSVTLEFTGQISLPQFLQALKMERFLPHFLKEDVDMDSLPLLSDRDLISLGLSLGPRRKLQAALAQRAMSWPKTW